MTENIYMRGGIAFNVRFLSLCPFLTNFSCTFCLGSTPSRSLSWYIPHHIKDVTINPYKGLLLISLKDWFLEAGKRLFTQEM